jgi:hypothetical protein
LQTFWISSSVQSNVVSERHQNSSLETVDMAEEDDEKTPMEIEQDIIGKQERLIDWMVEILLLRIKTLVSDVGVNQKLWMGHCFLTFIMHQFFADHVGGKTSIMWN